MKEKVDRNTESVHYEKSFGLRRDVLKCISILLKGRKSKSQLAVLMYGKGKDIQSVISRLDRDIVKPNGVIKRRYRTKDTCTSFRKKEECLFLDSDARVLKISEDCRTKYLELNMKRLSSLCKILKMALQDEMKELVKQQNKMEEFEKLMEEIEKKIKETNR